MKRPLVLALLFAAVPAAGVRAETLWVLKETTVKPIYPDIALISNDSVVDGWRLIEWTGNIGWEQEPRRSQGGNRFAFYLRGIPNELKPGMSFRVDYRYVRKYAGRLDGKVYRHEWDVSAPGFCECYAAKGPDIPDELDEYQGTLDYKCNQSFGTACGGYIAPAGRPWSAVTVTYNWVARENAVSSGRDTGGTPLGGGGGTSSGPSATPSPRTGDSGGGGRDDEPGRPRHEGPPSGGSGGILTGNGSTGSTGGPKGACSRVFAIGVAMGAAEAAALRGADRDGLIERLTEARGDLDQVFFFPPGGLDAILNALRGGARPQDVHPDLVKERRRFDRLATDHCACDITSLFQQR